MIHYSLRCEPAGHGFDGWFRSGADFEAQAARGFLECPVCGAKDVSKALMRPAVSTSERALSRPSEGAAAVGVPSEVSEAMARLQELAREVRAKADYVGNEFAEEARRIHYGEAEERQIYGEASGGDVRALMEEGITAIPLPPLPEDKN